MRETSVPSYGCAHSSKTVRRCPLCIPAKYTPGSVYVIDENRKVLPTPISLNKRRNWERLEQLLKRNEELKQRQDRAEDDEDSEEEDEEFSPVVFCHHDSTASNIAKAPPSSYVVSVPWGGLPPNQKRDAPELLVHHKFSRDGGKKSKCKEKGVRTKVVARDHLRVSSFFD